MKRLFALALAIALASMVQAKVWTTVYRCDETTPLEAVDPNYPTVYRDIMVGTRLVIIISSDVGEYWWGALRVSWDDANDATLSGRGYDPKRSVYTGSSLDAAGRDAATKSFTNFWGIGLDFETWDFPLSPPVATPGDWFVVDYRADQVGVCGVGFYDLVASFDLPIQMLSFTHVPSRDFDNDGIVSLTDFALFASRWCPVPPPTSNSADASFDLNSDGCIDARDLALFSEYWLERSDCHRSTRDPNDSTRL